MLQDINADYLWKKEFWKVEKKIFFQLFVKKNVKKCQKSKVPPQMVPFNEIFCFRVKIGSKTNISKTPAKWPNFTRFFKKS